MKELEGRRTIGPGILPFPSGQNWSLSLYYRRYLKTKNVIRLFKDGTKVRFVAILSIKLTFSLLVSGNLSKFSHLCSAVALLWHSCVTLGKTAVKRAR